MTVNSMLKRRFEKASKDVWNLTSMPENDDLLSLYALYKQATEGDCEGAKPWGAGMKEIAKWNAWKEIEGKDPNDAMNEYIALVKELMR